MDGETWSELGEQMEQPEMILAGWEHQARERDVRDPLRVQILEEAATIRARITALSAEVEALKAEALDHKMNWLGTCDELRACEADRDAAEARGYARGLEEAAKVAQDFTTKEHIAADMKAGIFPVRSNLKDAIAAAIRAKGEGQ